MEHDSKRRISSLDRMISAKKVIIIAVTLSSLFFQFQSTLSCLGTTFVLGVTQCHASSLARKKQKSNPKTTRSGRVKRANERLFSFATPHFCLFWSCSRMNKYSFEWKRGSFSFGWIIIHLNEKNLSWWARTNIRQVLLIPTLVACYSFPRRISPSSPSIFPKMDIKLMSQNKDPTDIINSYASKRY